VGVKWEDDNEDITIQNCYMEGGLNAVDNNAAGIAVWGTNERITIKGNHIKTPGEFGIYIYEAGIPNRTKEAIIVDNIVDGAKYGIRIYTTTDYEEFIISNNILLNNTDRGIFCTGNLIITNNQISNGSYAIVWFGGKGIVMNNFFFNQTYRNIDLNSLSGTVVKNNHGTCISTYSFRIDSCSNIVLEDNFVDKVMYITDTTYAQKDFKGDVIVGGNLTVEGYIAVTGNLTVGGNLTVSGNLSVTGNLTVTGDIIGATGRTADFIVVANNAPQWWKNQADYLCDASDDQIEINSALENCTSGDLRKEAGRVVLSEGKFDITDTINVPYSKWLIGQGGKGGAGFGHTWLDWQGGSDVVVFYNEPAAVIYDIARGGGIIGVGIDGNDVTGVVGIRMRRTWHTTIEDIAIRNCETGMISEANINLDVHRFEIMYNNGDGILLTNWSIYNNSHHKFTAGEIGNNGIGNYSFNILSGTVSISDTWFENTYTDLGHVHLYIDDSVYDNVQLHLYNNRFQAMGVQPTSAIQIDGGKVYMSDNYVHCGGRYNGTGVNITDGYVIIEGNEFENWGRSAEGGTGVKIGGGTVVQIIGNRFEGMTHGGYAINVSGGTRIDIQDNSFTSGGIYVDISIDCVKISDNRFYDISDDELYCIYIGGSFTSVTNNYIFQVQKHGIHSASGEARNKIIGNTVYNIGFDAHNTYDGIYVKGFGHQVISNTVVSTSGIKTRYGIYAEELKPGEVNYNYVEGTASDNIYFTIGSEDYECIGNIVTDGTITVADSRMSATIRDNQYYVHISEIRGTIANILEICGDVRGLWTFHEKTGSTAQDYSNKNHDLTANETLEDWDNKPRIKGRTTTYKANGIDEYLYTASHADFQFANAGGNDDSNFSVICVVRAYSDYTGTIIGKYDGTGAREWIVRLDDSSYPEFELYDESASAYIGREDQTAISSTDWYVLVFTYNGSETSAGINIYKNGVVVDDADHESGSYVGMEQTASNVTIFANESAVGPTYSSFYSGYGTWFSIVGNELTSDEVWIITQELWSLLGL
jgi:hypothetical protein